MPLDTKPALRPLATFSPIQWEGRIAPDPDWLIEDVVLRKTVALFSGPGETGKSMLMQQLMTACATEKPWLGMRVPNVRSFGLFAEDPQSVIWRRQEGINRHYCISHADLEDVEMMSIDEMDDPCLYRPTRDAQNGKPTRLWQQIVSKITEFGAQLVILDNVGAIFEANENYKEHVRPFIGLLIKLAREIDGAVVLIQHPGQAGENDGSAQSGSRSWRNSVRAQMILSRVPEEDPENPSDERVLRFGKANYGRRKAGMRIEWNDGLFVPCTLADQQGGLTNLDRIELRAKVEQALRHGIARGNRYSMANGARNHIATELRRDKSWHRYAWGDINSACETMLAEGRIVLVDVKMDGHFKKCVRPLDVAYGGEK